MTKKWPDEKRIDIIGQNGNEGTHYLDVKRKMMEEHEDTVTISRKEYNRLKEREDWLQCLETAGVDNWSGIDEAYDLREE